MMNTDGTSAYSADVSLHLRVNGSMFALSQMGPNRVVLREETALPDGPAEVVATIDGQAEKWSVEITDRHLSRRVVPIVLITDRFTEAAAGARP